MGTIGVHEFVSLDGVYESPSWTADYPFEPAMGEAIGAIMGAAPTILLGRRTYEMFAPAWSQRTVDDDPGAPVFNDSPKYVVTSTLTAPDWNNTRVLGPYDADSIRDLKNSTAGNIYVSGSGTLVRAMLADGLVDELHLFVYPVVLGEGERLFTGDLGAIRLALLDSESYANGVLHLTYGPARD